MRQVLSAGLPDNKRWTKQPVAGTEAMIAVTCGGRGDDDVRVGNDGEGRLRAQKIMIKSKNVCREVER